MSAIEETCPDCQGSEANMDARIIGVRKDEATGELVTFVTWHTEDCPSYTVDRILLEDGARRVKEQDEWAKQAFPVALERLRAAAADAPESPFVTALLELASEQGADLGRFVPPHRWVEIMDRHFPPQGGESTA